MKSKLKSKQDEYPFRNSLLALTLDNEIYRLANEKGLQVGEVITKLANNTNVSERQIYNYRSGKTDFQASHIPVFCKEFGSNALALALLNLCDETEIEVPEDFDIVSLASRTARHTLSHHEKFLNAFEDKQIDGFELTHLKHSTAESIRNMRLLEEIAITSYEQQQNRQGLRGQ